MPELHPHWETNQLQYDKDYLALQQHNNFDLALFENPDDVEVYDDVFQNPIAEDIFLSMRINSWGEGWLYITLSLSEFQEGQYEIDGLLRSSGVEETQHREDENSVRCDRCHREIRAGEYKIEFYRGRSVKIHAHECWSIILDSIESVLQQV